MFYVFASLTSVCEVSLAVYTVCPKSTGIPRRHFGYEVQKPPLNFYSKPFKEFQKLVRII